MWMLLILGAVVVGGVALQTTITALRRRGPSRALRVVATELGGEFNGSLFAPKAIGRIHDRPFIIELVEERQGKYTVEKTRIAVCARHPDDIAMAKPAHDSTPAAWIDAWETADIAAKMADLPRTGSFGMPLLVSTENGVIRDAATLIAIVRRLAAQLDAEERTIASWRDSADVLKMTCRGAWYLDGTWRGGWIRIAGDPASRMTVVRARVEPRSEGEDRWSDAARELERRVVPDSVSFDQFEVRVVVPGIEPDLPRWQHAIALATTLASAASTGPYR